MKSTDFSIGDRVRIREWDDMAKEFGTDDYGDIQCTSIFTSEMKHLCGEEFIITEMRKPASRIRKGMVVGHIGGWAISTDMIEPFDKEGGVPEDVPEELLDFLKRFAS